MERKLDMHKITQLPTVNDDLDDRYGKEGTRSRDEFNAKSRAWYYAECIKNARIKAGLTQKDVAERIGKKREYVALIERGETDMQLSTFIMMSEAVGLHFVLSY
ncbi:MAG: helix-turn-helix transcriptional regulator [Bacteroidales bacterium]|nr:helix-turn-helix transcriptional regulator [Bacteroidales bacterium]